MTEDRWDEHPEELLAGADRPRPLAPAMRARLEATLAAAARVQDNAIDARPLSAEVRDRLAVSLRPASRAWNWRALGGICLAAAAIVVVVGVVVPGLVHRAPTTALNATVTGVAPVAPRAATHSSSTYSRFPTHPLARPLGKTPITSNVSFAPTKEFGQPSKQRPAVPAPRPAGPVVTASSGMVTFMIVVGNVSPARGASRGGNWVAVHGDGFARVTAVDFGATAAARFHVMSTNELKALAPAHPPGRVHVVVVTRAGVSIASIADWYSYVAP